MKHKRLKRILLLIASGLGAFLCLLLLTCNFISYNKSWRESVYERQVLLQVNRRLHKISAETSLEKEIAKINGEALMCKGNSEINAYTQAVNSCLYLDSLFGFDVVRILEKAVPLRKEGYGQRYLLQFEDGSSYDYLRLNVFESKEIKKGCKIRHVLSFFPTFDAEQGIYVPMKMENFKYRLNGIWCSF